MNKYILTPTGRKNLVVESDYHNDSAKKSVSIPIVGSGVFTPHGFGKVTKIDSERGQIDVEHTGFWLGTEQENPTHPIAGTFPKDQVKVIKNKPYVSPTLAPDGSNNWKAGNRHGKIQFFRNELAAYHYAGYLPPNT